MSDFINNPDKKYKVAVVSDTHNLLRSKAYEALDGVDLIIHAGDIGSLDLLRKLEEIAPVCAVQGNTDFAPGISSLPQTNCIEIGGVFLYILHDLNYLDIVPASSNVDIVIHGHTHQPDEFTRDDVLYLNPGSIGPIRYDYPISMAFLTIEKNSYSLHHLTFDK